MPTHTAHLPASPSASPPPPRPPDLGSPAAPRLRPPRWLDLRLIAGVLLVLGSVAVGARVVAAADETVPALVAARDLLPGEPLTAEMVQARDVRLETGVDLYYTGEVGAGYVVVRPIGRGELVPRGAVSATASTDEVRYVTLPIPGLEAPAGLSAGNLVDVWVVPSRAADGAAAGDLTAATRLLDGVTVVDSSAGSGGFADAAGQVRITLAIAADEGLEEVTAELLAAARAGLVYLSRLPEPAP